MINQGELYTCTLETPLANNGADIGHVSLRYEVRQVTDVRNLSQARTYRILVSQRIVVPNRNGYSFTPGGDTRFMNYPAMLGSTTTLNTAQGVRQRLVAYSPRTLNATVSTSANQSDGTSSSYSQQNTSGSSTSTTNSYGVSASLGFFGDDPTGSISGDYSHSSTQEYSASDSYGVDAGRSSQAERGSAMSIKDWGSYAYLDKSGQVPTWVWGQEYPWDVIQFRFCPQGNEVVLPQFVQQRLFGIGKDAGLVNPPSQLSLFGIDFTMKATWMVELPQDPAQQVLKLDHALQYVTASHWLDGSTRHATLDPVPFGFQVSSPPLDLTLLGLDPVQGGASDNGAVVGFIPSKFIAPPVAGKAFKIISTANNLQVTGTGFEAAMRSSFSAGAATLRVQFKVADDEAAYSLFMKHWKTGAGGCLLEFTFNGDASQKVVRLVDALEGEGGEKNLLTLNLRNKDYTSVDYHDYLVMGLNTVDVKITPLDGTAAGYELRALAVGEE